MDVLIGGGGGGGVNTVAERRRNRRTLRLRLGTERGLPFSHWLEYLTSHAVI